MGRKCGVEGCLSDSARPEDTGVTFHKVPMHSDIRPKWMSLCHIPEDKKNVKVIYICSRHFLRADFCSFKGKKYMLKQGVLPSVFPWHKQKLENTADSKMQQPQVQDIKTEHIVSKDETENESPVNIKTEISEQVDIVNIKKEPAPEGEFKKNDNIPHNSEQSTMIEQKEKSVSTVYGKLSFAINKRIEALDFNEIWYPARIVEIDYEENEVLIHFEKYSSKYDEWICMSSARLRPLQTKKFAVGERCMASWCDSRKFPATISQIMEDDSYQVRFDDGLTKVLKSHRIAKAHGRSMQSSPLFDPVQGSKQDRRDKKRKINVAELFGKRSRFGSPEEKSLGSPEIPTTSATNTDEYESWTPSWENGRPVGIESTIETNDGTRKSVIVPDPRLPKGWVKHLTQRAHGASAGKWDSIIVSPEGRRFRARSEIKAYLEDSPLLKYCETMFDFSLYRRHRKVGVNLEKRRSSYTPTVSEQPPLDETVGESSAEEGENLNSLKIPVVGSAYKCPIEGCNKTFRKENIAQMHVKHYHPEYTKFLDSTPNVADLAYARTVGESLDRSPGPSKPTPVRQVQKVIPPKPAPITPAEETKPQLTLSTKAKDSEIIKLLNSKPFDNIKKEDDGQVPALPSGLPSSMYPDIKLKDLLNKSEGIPKRDDLNLKTLSASTSRPTGIKTLLPVIRTEPKNEDTLKDVDINTKIQYSNSHKMSFTKSNFKRKRQISDSMDVPKYYDEIKQETVTQEQQQQQNNVIIEGGEVIKIVQMKREEIINCTCGITEEDGLMIQCELCLCWQHAYCNNIERENQVPEKYVCYICQNPVRQRSSRKYFHDQDWLKFGTLPVGNYHTKDNEILMKRYDKLKKSHDITGGLLELKDFMHTLKMKLNIAEAKNHPKLYLWSKSWEKLPLPEKIEQNEEKKPKLESGDHQYTKNDLDYDVKNEQQTESMLFSILKSGKEQQKLSEFPKIDISTLIENNLDQLTTPVTPAPIIPQPEAAIDSADCRINLLDHIAHSQSLVDERLNDFEEQLNVLEANSNDSEINDIRTKQTLQMLLRDINTLKEFSCNTNL